MVQVMRTRQSWEKGWINPGPFERFGTRLRGSQETDDSAWRFFSFSRYYGGILADISLRDGWYIVL
jgi:hypothetical protein